MMDNEIKEAKVIGTDEVGKMKATLRALPDAARAEVLSEMLPVVPLAWGRPPTRSVPITTEQDIEAIMRRTGIYASVTPPSGSVINVGENFTLKVVVYNGTSHNLRDAELVAVSTEFASLVGPNVVGASAVVALGDLTAGQAANATFQCQAIAQTPTQGGPPERLINLRVRAVLDFLGGKSEPVLGEVLPN